MSNPRSPIRTSSNYGDAGQLRRSFEKKKGIMVSTLGLSAEQTDEQLLNSNGQNVLAIYGEPWKVQNGKEVKVRVLSQGNYGSLTLGVTDQKKIYVKIDLNEKIIEIKRWDRFIAAVRKSWENFKNRKTAKKIDPQVPRGISPVYGSTSAAVSLGQYKQIPNKPLGFFKNSILFSKETMLQAATILNEIYGKDRGAKINWRVDPSKEGGNKKLYTFQIIVKNAQPFYLTFNEENLKKLLERDRSVLPSPLGPSRRSI